MNKRTKSIIALTLVTMITSYGFLLQGSTTVKATNKDVEKIYESKDKDSLGGFELISKKWIEDIHCNAYNYKHIKSGANLIFIDNKNEEKWFIMNFRTQPKNETGVNHIIEHCTSGGSKNYPVKNPIKQIGKQSLGTHFVAQTTTEFTGYPIASKNDKDFQKLMSIKLDSVFYPDFLKDKKMFKQEAWRYELNSPEDELKYNGSVYNEEKGIYSDPDFLLNTSIIQSLFPDTTYKFVVGGNPDDIPKLTYEDFIKTYNEYYIPSNCCFYLSGNIDIEEKLKFIGDKYLNNFDKKEVGIKEEIQNPFNERKMKTSQYSIPNDMPIENKCYLSSNYVIDTLKNREVMQGFQLLQILLKENSSSPLIKALQSNGFGDICNINFDTEYFQPVFSISVKNTKENEKERFQKVIDETLQDIVKNGFDKELINSCINSFELSSILNSSKYDLQLDYTIMKQWLHDIDPLENSLTVPDLKKKIEEGWLQELIKKYLLNNTHTSLVVLKPEAGLQERKESELKKHLSSLKDSFSKEKINELINETKEFNSWVDTPDSEESIATIPRLSPKDINRNVKNYSVTEDMINGIKTIKSPASMHDGVYIRLVFDASKIPQEKIGYLHLLNGVLNNVGTQNYTLEKLNNELTSDLTDLRIDNDSYIRNDNSNIYSPKETISYFSTKDKLDKSLKLIKEIICNSNLNDKNNIKQIIGNLKNNLDYSLKYMDYGIAVNTMNAYISESGKYNDLKNATLYSFLCDLDENFESKSDEILKNLEEVRAVIFDKQDLIVSFSGEEDAYKTFTNSFNDFSKDLKYSNLPKYNYTFNDSRINEGIISASNVNTIIKGGNLSTLGYKPDGKLMVLKNILDNEYLSENIAKKGGAYWSSIFLDNSNMLFISSKDPNLKETLNTFDNIPNYLRKFNADENQMTDYIIGTIGSIEKKNDSVTTCRGIIGDSILSNEFYFGGVTQSKLEKQKEEILSTKAEDIRNLAPTIEALLKQNYLCVVGDETKIQENKKNFMIIKDLMTSKEEQGKIIDMDNKEIDDENKEWTVKFSTEVNPITVNLANVYVLDEQNHKVDVKVAYDKENNTIKITPEKKYDKGKKYTLFIKDIESTNGTKGLLKLLAPMKMEFKIKK